MKKNGCLEDLIDLIEDFIEFIKNKHKKHLSFVQIEWGQPTEGDGQMQQLRVGQTISYNCVGFDQFGNDFPLPDGTQFSWTEDSGGVVISIDTLDAESGTAKAINEGSADVTVGVLVTNPDGSTESFVAADAVTVIPAIIPQPILSAIGIQWGEPQGALAGAGAARVGKSSSIPLPKSKAPVQAQRPALQPPRR